MRRFAKRKVRSSSPDGAARLGAIRLQKALAAAGVGSRRQCEELIREGRVDVDGQTVTELGTRVDPRTQQIRVDGQSVRRPKRNLYFAINKPVGVISTSNDPSGRPRVIDLAPTHERLFTIGRLDKSSGGLILATNDGQLTDLLTHPRYGVEKTYLAEVAGVPTREAIEKLQRGVRLAEGFAHAKRITVRRAHRHSATLEIVLDEGRNREVRRLLARIGHKVMKLTRVAIGPLRLANLQPGESRPLSREEVEELYRAAHRRRKHDKPREHRKASSSDTPGKPEGRSIVQPIIDRSLPVDARDSEDNLLQFVGADSADATSSGVFVEADTAAIDLSPIDRGRRRQQHARTIIGGQPAADRPSGMRHRDGRRQFQATGKAKGRNRKRR
jgi:23S rRNA pseudouridine2605 synthase